MISPLGCLSPRVQRGGAVGEFRPVALDPWWVSSLLVDRRDCSEDSRRGKEDDGGDGCPRSGRSLRDAREIRPACAGPGCSNADDDDDGLGRHGRRRDDDSDAAAADARHCGGACLHYHAVSESKYALDLDDDDEEEEDWIDGAIHDDDYRYCWDGRTMSRTADSPDSTGRHRYRLSFYRDIVPGCRYHTDDDDDNRHHTGRIEDDGEQGATKTSDRCDHGDDDTPLLVLRRDDAGRNTGPASAAVDGHHTSSARKNRDSRSSRSYPTAPIRRPLPPCHCPPPRLAS